MTTPRLCFEFSLELERKSWRKSRITANLKGLEIENRKLFFQVKSAIHNGNGLDVSGRL